MSSTENSVSKIKSVPCGSLLCSVAGDSNNALLLLKVIQENSWTWNVCIVAASFVNPGKGAGNGYIPLSGWYYKVCKGITLQITVVPDIKPSNIK